MNDESCFLPNPCDCNQCQWWGENGWDLDRTPDWQQKEVRRRTGQEEDDESI